MHITISRKYPNIIFYAVDESRTINETDLPVDATQPNPNFQVGCFTCYVF